MELPVYLFHQGTNFHAYDVLGAHYHTTGKTDFVTWAPDAAAVSVVGAFNGWEVTANPMTRLNDQGLWGTTLTETREYDCYKYAITTANGRILYKADPYARHSETAPGTASKLYRVEGYRWSDAKWMSARERKNPYTSPMNIYEVHMGSWRRSEDGEVYD